MDITEVRVFPMNEDKLKAYATITFDNCFVVRDLKVISGNTGLFVAMPSKKRKDGTFKDIAHPLNNDFRAKIEKVVLDAYQKEVEAVPERAGAPAPARGGPQAPGEGGARDGPQAPSPAPAREKQILSTPKIESKTPDQINPKDYSAPDE